MTLRLYTDKETLDITTNASVTIKDLLTQLEEGNLVLIETIYNSTFIINCLNINAIEILGHNPNKFNSPPIS